MTADGTYRHTPGKLSRWGVIDVGLKCPHSCKFCYYARPDDPKGPYDFMRHAQWLPTEHLLELARSLKANGFVGFDVTGGEPTLHPGIVELAEEANGLGLAMRVITLGQHLTRDRSGIRLIDQLVTAGVSDFLFSVHAVDPENFKKITGGSWANIAAAMTELASLGFDYCTNTTVHEGNFRLLPEIAAEISKHRVYAANLIVMNAYYAWSSVGGKADEVQGHYGEIYPYLIEARDILEAAGIAVNIRYAPLCTVKGAERNLVGITGVRHDPHEWMNAIDHMEPGDPKVMGQRLPLRDWETGYPLTAERGLASVLGAYATRSGKVFPVKCRDCAAINVCDGIDRRYLAERGDGELEPYTEFRGDVLDRERLRYLPAFICKVSPFADARGAVRQAFEEMAAR